MLLSALLVLGQLTFSLAAPLPSASASNSLASASGSLRSPEKRTYPSLSYYGYIDEMRAVRPPGTSFFEQPLDLHASDNAGAVGASKARAALMRSEGLSHKTWEVSTFYQAKAELYGVTEFGGSAKSFLQVKPDDDSIFEATSKLPKLLDIGSDGYLVNGDRGSQADVFSLVPLVWASGDQKAAKKMLAWLYQSGTRDEDAGGIFSHRGDVPQLWSDQGYMTPPTLAFLGLVQNDDGLLRDALRQWTATANALKDDCGAFRHVPSSFDPHAWTSGTGWMLQGIARVFASIKAAGKTEELRPEINDAKDLARRALFAAFGAQTDDGRLPNYTDRDSPPETAGTAAVTAAYYRLLALEPDIGNSWLFDRAEKAYGAVMDQVSDDGTVSGCVDPSGANFDNTDTDDSPEGHAFIALMWAARNQWLGYHPDGKLPPGSGGN